MLTASGGRPSGTVTSPGAGGAVAGRSSAQTTEQSQTVAVATMRSRFAAAQPRRGCRPEPGVAQRTPGDPSRAFDPLPRRGCRTVLQLLRGRDLLRVFA